MEMFKLLPPIRHAYLKYGWGKLNSLEDFFWTIKSNGQSFSQNAQTPACYFIKDAPCDKTIYEYFGKKGHGAIDISLPTGTPIYAAHDGKVLSTSEDAGAGLGVVILGEGFKTDYWHHKVNYVGEGRMVKAGDLIALSGATGMATGPHLHFALKQTDPNDNKGNTINKDNGYLGGIDPLPYFIWPDEMKFKLWRAKDTEDVYIIRNDQKLRLMNAGALLAIADFGDVEEVPPSQLAAVPDSGRTLAEIIEQ